jgi:hypothetical protein
MRTPEWIQLVFMSLLVVAAQLRRLERDRQLNVALLALVAIAAISAVKFGEHWIPPYHVSIVWDWMPGAVILIPYWQVGQFFTIADPTTEARLTAFDRAFFRRVGLNPADTRVSTITSAYLELTYFLVYPLVPLGVVTLYITRLRSAVDFYWVVVLSTTYLCYGSTLAIRARPARMLLVRKISIAEHSGPRIKSRDSRSCQHSSHNLPERPCGVRPRCCPGTPLPTTLDRAVVPVGCSKHCRGYYRRGLSLCG